MKTTTRDNILYLTIAFAVLGILGICAWYQDAHGQRIHMPISIRQFALVFMTAGVFGYAIREWRRAWHNTRFWIVLSLLFVAYVPLQFCLIQVLGTQVTTYSLIAVIELFVVLVILEKLVPQRHVGKVSRNHSSDERT